MREHLVAPATLAAVIAIVAAATIAAAWGFEWAGYAPCELCLKERLPYYGGIPLAILVVWLARRNRTSLLPAGFAGLALMFGAGAVLAAYHAGVEWKFWPGPTSCTGSLAHPEAVGDFLKQLRTTTVVQCDVVAIRILGLSLASWDAVICAGLTGLALVGLFGRPSVSARSRLRDRDCPEPSSLKHSQRHRTRTYND